MEIAQQRFPKWAVITAVVSAVALIVALITIPLLGMASTLGKEAPAALPNLNPSPTASASPTSEPKECADTWKMVPADHSNNRWFFEGIAEIKSASTPEEAAAAAAVWSDRVREDETLLAGAAEVFLKKDVDKATLIDANGCATDAALDLSTGIMFKIANAQEIVPDEVPTDATNTGVNDEVVVADATSGISGDRKAIRITLDDGRVIWIMGRCGNIATPGGPPPGIPPGTTDEKHPWEDPGPRGNAPVGQGPNADSGPGEYIAPENMEQPPAAPRVNPAPPAPVPPAPQPPTPSNPSPAPVPTPDPAPAPPKEEVAPAPTEPVAPCIIPPGWSTCTAP